MESKTLDMAPPTSAGLAATRPDRLLFLAGVLQVVATFTPAARMRIVGGLSFVRLPNAGMTLVVLGLLTTKLGTLESREALIARITEAAEFMPIEQMCLSPQCGFSSTVHGNEIAVESQAAKLRLAVETATEIWGGV